MQSEVKEHLEKSKPLKRQMETLAGEADQKKFWKDLRYFYRTGEKPKGSLNKGLTSIFKYKLEQLPQAYPVVLDNKEFIFSNDTTFHFIDHYLSVYQLDTIDQFKYKINSIISSLARLLEVSSDDSISSESYDFADELIAFDKLSKLVPKYSGSALSTGRKKRLNKVFELLKQELSEYQTAQALLLIAGGKQFDKASSRFQVIPIKKNEAVKEAHAILKEQLEVFTSLIKAYRIAMLEVDNVYDELIHDDYFSHFTWYRLSAEEKSWFRPVFLQIDHQLVMQQLDEWSRLLSTNWPIKLLVMNHSLVSEPEKGLSWEEASHSYRQELTALTVAHRNVSTYQMTLNNPDLLTPLIQEWIGDSQLSLLHLLIAADKEELLKTKAAIYGRYFPQLTYSRNKGMANWNMDNNPSPENIWPLMNFEIEKNGKINQDSIAFTYADYKAFFDAKVEELMVVPAAYESDYLVAFSDYLELTPQDLIGKIPFIWLVDKDQNLHKAAVPNVWVVSCQERMDNWIFLQGLTSKTSVPTTSDPAADTTFTDEQLKQVREEATQLAANRLIKELLSDI